MDPFPNSLVVRLHDSVFPETLSVSRRASLRKRQIDPKFHYETPKQAWRWLKIHQTFSPAQTDPSCLQIYNEAMEAVAHALDPKRPVQLISLGCGGGQKEAQFFRHWLNTRRRSTSQSPCDPTKNLAYLPADISAGLTVTASKSACEAGLNLDQIEPVVMDLGGVSDWQNALIGPNAPSGSQRVVCFLGMLPNFRPDQALSSLTDLLGPDDWLVISANLAPGTDSFTGTRQVLPLYDNPPTHEWLQTFLWDCGVEREDGGLSFHIARCPHGSGLHRIEAKYVFQRHRTLNVDGEAFEMAPGTVIDVFFSYRHTMPMLDALLFEHGLKRIESWTNRSMDEGVFLVRKMDFTGISM
jgi:uncharacterized SAM-dependent methyltransferase